MNERIQNDDHDADFFVVVLLESSTAFRTSVANFLLFVDVRLFGVVRFGARVADFRIGFVARWRPRSSVFGSTVGN